MSKESSEDLYFSEENQPKRIRISFQPEAWLLQMIEKEEAKRLGITRTQVIHDFIDSLRTLRKRKGLEKLKQKYRRLQNENKRLHEEMFITEKEKLMLEDKNKALRETVEFLRQAPLKTVHTNPREIESKCLEK